MGNVQDKISKKLQSSDDAEVASGVKTFESHILSSSALKLCQGNFFNHIFAILADIASSTTRPLTQRRRVVEGLRSLGKVSVQVGADPGFHQPLARHIYPALILGLFESDPELNGHIIIALEVINQRNFVPLWHHYVANAVEFVQARSHTDTGTDTATHVLQSLVQHGRRLCQQTAGRGEGEGEGRLSKEARIVFYFLLNILQFETRTACLSAVLLEFNTALTSHFYLEPHILTTALTSALAVMRQHGDANPDNVCDMAAATTESIIISSPPEVLSAHVASLVALLCQQLSNPRTRLGWRRWCLRLVLLILERHTQLPLTDALADDCVRSIMTCMDQFQSFSVAFQRGSGDSGGGGDSSTVEPRHHAVFETCMNCLEHLLRLPRIGAWRGEHYVPLIQRLARATVFTRADLRALLGPALAAMYLNGRLSFVYDFSKLLMYYMSWFLSQQSLHAVLAYSQSRSLRRRSRAASAMSAVSVGGGDGDNNDDDDDDHDDHDPQQWPAPHITLDQCPQTEQDMTQLFSFLADYLRYPAASNFAFCTPSGAGSTGSSTGSTTGTNTTTTTTSKDTDMDPFNQVLAQHLTQTSDLLSQLLTVFSEHTPDRRVFATVLTIFGGEVQKTRQLLLANSYAHALAGIVLRVLDSNTVERQQRVSQLEMETRSLQVQLAQARAQAGRLAQGQDVSAEKKDDLQRQLEQLQQSLCCCICLDSFIGRDPVALQCGHILCSECSNRVQHARVSSRKCPQCRHTLDQAPLALKGLG